MARSLALLLLVASAVVAAPSQAVVLKVTGVLDDVWDGGGLGTPLAPGDAFTVFLQFPPRTESDYEFNEAGLLYSTYDLLPPSGAFFGQVGPWSVPPGSSIPWASLREGVGYDDTAYFVLDTQQLGDLDLVTGGGIAELRVQFDGPRGTLPSRALADLPTDLSVWSSAYFEIAYRLTDAGEFTVGTGAVLSVEVIPEPGTALLVAAGLAALGARRRAN